MKGFPNQVKFFFVAWQRFKMTDWLENKNHIKLYKKFV